MEKLKGTDYYNKLMGAIKYVKLIESYEKSSSEIKKIFRNIESKTVIPEPIYKENKYEIEKYIDILKIKYNRDMTSIERKKS